MIFYTKNKLQEYSKTDVILDQMLSVETPLDEQFISHNWLKQTLSKRLVFQDVYGDLINNQNNQLKILDVGGGYTSLTKKLIKNANYKLLDIMAHDNHQELIKLQKKLNNEFWINDDWFNFSTKNNFDIIVANDIFPNVDQRLGIFISKYLPLCKELRISLTYYNNNRFYKVKRTDAEEIFFILAYNAQKVLEDLNPFTDRIIGFNQKHFIEHNESIFSNGRIITYIKIKGDFK